MLGFNKFNNSHNIGLLENENHLTDVKVPKMKEVLNELEFLK